MVRPNWLGKVSYESGFIAFLIFTLMVTYLATFIPGWEESQAAVVGAHSDDSGVPAADPAYQAPAPGPEPRDCFPGAARVSATFRPWWAMRISAWTPAKT